MILTGHSIYLKIFYPFLYDVHNLFRRMSASSLVTTVPSMENTSVDYVYQFSGIFSVS